MNRVPLTRDKDAATHRREPCSGPGVCRLELRFIRSMVDPHHRRRSDVEDPESSRAPVADSRTLSLQSASSGGGGWVAQREAAPAPKQPAPVCRRTEFSTR